MKMGMETQNWAYSTGFRFGKTCRRSRRHPRQPQARACRTNSEFRKVRVPAHTDRKSTRLNSSHLGISYAVFCLKKKIFLPLCEFETHSRHRDLHCYVLLIPLVTAYLICL